ncbi:MAG TPA: methionine-R-sulfoxide reductase [Planctomycetaceae bacterium]|nr:methionine-R-sulfoxide reductase [Planctomycetaceae bacterium]
MLFRILPLTVCVVLVGCADNLAPDTAARKPSVDDIASSNPIEAAAETETSAESEDPETSTGQNDQTEPDSDAEASPKKVKPVKFNSLSEFEEWIILRKGTERAFVGEYTDTEDAGTYICRRCNAPLYKSDHKFHSNCGWPAFDDEIKGAVERKVDADGYRVEILCKNCGGHLGHVFEGEQFTDKNVRHCVNSVSMKLVRKGEKLPEVILAKDVKASEEAARKAAEAGADTAVDETSDTITKDLPPE